MPHVKMGGASLMRRTRSASRDASSSPPKRRSTPHGVSVARRRRPPDALAPLTVSAVLLSELLRPRDVATPGGGTLRVAPLPEPQR